jgi:hypothetical protein
VNQELVSIVTPTMPGRENTLLDRCIPSVKQLNWRNVEHVIVSDHNIALRGRLRAEGYLDDPSIRFVEINDTWRDGTQEKSVGATPWLIGSLLALGEFIGFLGDDDAILPDHVDRHVTMMKQTESTFSVSVAQFIVRGEPVFQVGDSTFAHGHLDATGIMCYKYALRYANWNPNGEDAADYRLVRDWQTAGLRGVFVGGDPTVHHHDGWAA